MLHDTDLLNTIWISFISVLLGVDLSWVVHIKPFTFYWKKIYRKENNAALRSNSVSTLISHKSFGAIVLGSSLKEDESILF